MRVVHGCQQPSKLVNSRRNTKQNTSSRLKLSPRKSSPQPKLISAGERPEQSGAGCRSLGFPHIRACIACGCVGRRRRRARSCRTSILSRTQPERDGCRDDQLKTASFLSLHANNL
ncbi:hypothetical protein BRADI_3g30452v3 [Brachypodium distachyon]|uniref:Uncharacterized protein n=1 Tax=Brachypodium distachyon TaxID=15368 RepID=A0A2K2D076_BRADI|nr:hypothetical protein BRADI_3g30452v3 [Brachypodium distachyon]